jgi:hypothetical protein
MSEQLTPDQIREAILIYCDAIDAASTQLRRNLGGQPFKRAEVPQTEKAKAEKPKIDAAKITWQWMEAPGNPKGPYQRATLESAGSTAGPEFEALLAAIKSTKFYRLEGWQYWLFSDQRTIGRRAIKGKAAP